MLLCKVLKDRAPRVGWCDTILYGGTPAEYLRVEFLSANLPAYRADDVPAIPLWDTLIFG